MMILHLSTYRPHVENVFLSLTGIGFIYARRKFRYWFATEMHPNIAKIFWQTFVLDLTWYVSPNGGSRHVGVGNRMTWCKMRSYAANVAIWFCVSLSSFACDLANEFKLQHSLSGTAEPKNALLSV